MTNLIQLLQGKQLLWQGHKTPLAQNTCASGFTEIDQQLQGGWPEMGVIDVTSETGIGELRLFMPYLKQQTTQDRLTVFIAAPGTISGEMLQAQKLAVAQVIVIQPQSANDALWAAEQCLKSGTCNAVFLWLNNIEIHQVKRLQLAAETGHSLQVIIKPPQANTLALPVPLSMQLRPEPQGLQVEIKKRRGGWPAAPFSVNLALYWPQLALSAARNNVVPFPHSQAV